jgi:hypothetical protein
MEFGMCFECDSIWRPGEVVSDEQGVNFERYMLELGRAIDWGGVEKVSVVE